MKAKTVFNGFCNQLAGFWQAVRTQTSGFATPAVIAVLVCVVAGIALQRQADTQAKTTNLASRGPAHQQLTDWVAEFYACPQGALEGSCKRVFQRQNDGKYSVANERLPLGRGRFVSDTQFSSRPTHVRLSHRLSDEENQLLQKNWSKDKPVLALTGFPVCDGGNCKLEDFVLPMNRITVDKKNWIQFDSPVTADGQFGPQTLPPVLVSQSKAHQVFSILTEKQNGFFFEFGLAVLAPIMAIALTIWAGKPRIYMAFSHFLVAKSLWVLVAADTLMQQPIILSKLSLKGSFALSAFLAGWVFAAAMNFLSIAWCQKYLSRRMTTTLGAGFALLALLSTYFASSPSNAAVVTLRTFEFVIATSCALLIASAYVALKQQSWNNRLADFLRNIWKPEQGTRWEQQMKGLLVSFSVASVVGLWVIVESKSNPFVFNWGAILMPTMLTFVLLTSRPQLTQADVQVHKDHVEQQELLVKLLSQLGTFKHRGQAISLVVNFCNRELPKLGFETPQYVEIQTNAGNEEADEAYDVVIRSAVRGPHQTFGWIIARARKRTEKTAIGERIVEALSSALALHLDSIIRTSLLESESNTAQKFVPRDLVRFFGVTNLGQLDAAQEYRFYGTAVSVSMRLPTARGRELEGAPERGIINELSALFMKATVDAGGYVVSQEGLKWTVLFRDMSTAALKWIETTQIALRNWNQHRSSLSMPVYECSFGAQVSTLTLSFSEHAGVLRPWIQFDPQGVSATLADVAHEYNATALLSQDYVSMLASGRGAGYLPDAVRPLDKVWNRTKTATVDVYEFFGGDPDARRAAKQKTVETFSQGVKLYLSGHFDAAQSVIRQVTEVDPHDKAALRLLSNLSHGDDLKAA
ncbi:MAG: hypothetical protein FJY29_03900 [Betaproteobacteria bacterium]|nr:hypothetical protein [Betaproteobacteria bacterium]